MEKPQGESAASSSATPVLIVVLAVVGVSVLLCGGALVVMMAGVAYVGSEAETMFKEIEAALENVEVAKTHAVRVVQEEHQVDADFLTATAQPVGELRDSRFVVTGRSTDGKTWQVHVQVGDAQQCETLGVAIDGEVLQGEVPRILQPAGPGASEEDF